jgi:hypothetical protein
VKNLFLTFGIVAGVWATGTLAMPSVPVSVRMFGFLQPALKGPITAAILYEPGSAASEAEASAIEAAIGDGVDFGGGTLRVRRVPTNALGKLAGSRVAFVTAGIHDRQQLSGVTSHAGILTITSDAGCVRAAQCVVAVSSAPHMQITISRAAARAANIRFGSAFLMLVKEI